MMMPLVARYFRPDAASKESAKPPREPPPFED